jgi:hypothetical protein
MIWVKKEYCIVVTTINIKQYFKLFIYSSLNSVLEKKTNQLPASHIQSNGKNGCWLNNLILKARLSTSKQRIHNPGLKYKANEPPTKHQCYGFGTLEEHM